MARCTSVRMIATRAALGCGCAASWAADSPLAVQEIEDLVTHPLRVPDGVAAWRNVCDARDLVALDKTIRPEYAPADRIRDFLVVNDSANHHDITDYLRTAPLHDAVAALLT